MAVIKKDKSKGGGRKGTKTYVLGCALIGAAVLMHQNSVSLSSAVRRASDDSPRLACQKMLDSFDAKFNLQRANRKKNYGEYLEDDIYDTETYDLFEPEAVCFDEERFGSKERFNAYGDGPKFTCGVNLIAEKAKKGEECLVYSVGSNNKFDFEIAVKNAMGCETHTFDPTLKHPFRGGEYATFHPWGIGLDGEEKSFKEDFHWIGKGIETVMKELGHLNRTLDILKIDCEHCEYQAMPVLFEAIAAGRVKVNQIQIEMHGTLYPRVVKFFEAADKAKMRIFHKERNHWGCLGYKCVEYALISEDFLREANGASACSAVSSTA